MTNKDDDIHAEDYWLDRPGSIIFIIVCLIIICTILFFADAFYHKHVYFEIEDLFGFYGLFGFTVYVGLVLTAKWLRKFLMQPEDFYDRDA